MGCDKVTYEEHLDEVTTLLTEHYAMSDEAAIKLVMQAQAADFFTLHDDDPSICTQQRAEQDAKNIFEQSKAQNKQSNKKPIRSRK